MATPKIGRDFASQPKDKQEESALTPDKAAEVLLEFLPEDTQLLIREASQDMVVPIWQMLLGYVMRCHDGSLMYSPFLLSSWETGGKPNKARPCKGCGELFKSRFPDAAYCCNACAFDKLSIFGHQDTCPVTHPEVIT